LELLLALSILTVSAMPAIKSSIKLHKTSTQLGTKLNEMTEIIYVETFLRRDLKNATQLLSSDSESFSFTTNDGQQVTYSLNKGRIKRRQNNNWTVYLNSIAVATKMTPTITQQNLIVVNLEFVNYGIDLAINIPGE